MADEQLQKLVIKTVSGEGDITVEATFNPTQYVQDKSVAWQLQKNSEGNQAPLEFTSGANMTLSIELMFDLSEANGDVETEYVTKLRQMAMINDSLKRPPRCLVAWGSREVLSVVVEKVNATYNMFRPDGVPTRAKVALTLKECLEALNKDDAKAANERREQEQGTTAQAGSNRVDQMGSGNHRQNADGAGGQVNDRGQVAPGTQVTTGTRGR